MKLKAPKQMLRNLVARYGITGILNELVQICDEVALEKVAYDKKVSGDFHTLKNELQIVSNTAAMMPKPASSTEGL